MPKVASWYLDHRLWLEVFVLVNFAFLVPDIYLAHSTNLFRLQAEYIPLYFSVAAVLLLAAGLVALLWKAEEAMWRLLGHVVGWVAIGVGVAGLVLHLQSHFFHELTLASLVYTAPFAAPLAYTGLGFLLIMNRMVPPNTVEWPRWVQFFALGGFVGNLIFSLADHAQNGFFYRTEWIPVASSALAVGFLLVPFLMRVGRSFVVVCTVVLLIQAAVGLLGFYYHTTANLHEPSPGMFDRFVYGAPAMAPLLFPNLVVLAGIGLWVEYHELREVAAKIS